MLGLSSRQRALLVDTTSSPVDSDYYEPWYEEDSPWEEPVDTPYFPCDTCGANLYETTFVRISEQQLICTRCHEVERQNPVEYRANHNPNSEPGQLREDHIPQKTVQREDGENTGP